MAIEVVAQKGLDIHFTDKEMNRRLAERKQELELEKEGQNISSAESARPESASDFKKAFSELEKDFNDLIEKSGSLDTDILTKEINELSKESAGLRNYWYSSDSYDADAKLDGPSAKLEASLQDILGRKIDNDRIRGEVANAHAEWQDSMPEKFPTRTQEFEAALAKIEQFYAVLDENVKHLDPVMLEIYLDDVRAQRMELTSVYYAPDAKARLEGIERKFAEIISGMQNQQATSKENTSQQNQKPSQERPQGTRKIVHEGVLLEHGPAPYNFKPDLTKPEGERDDSYYVRLQGPTGKEKIVWGVTLEQAVEGLEIGERISLANNGKEKVEWEQKLANGQSEMRSGERVAWEGRPLDREVEVDDAAQYQTYEQYQTMDNDGPAVA